MNNMVEPQSGLSILAQLSERMRHTLPATKRSISHRRIVRGVGVNDCSYVTQPIRHPACPAYAGWKSLLDRCYGEANLKKNPTYTDCFVDRRWHLFSEFRKWWISNHKDGFELDKDLLIYGNRIYSPETCVFVPHNINAFIIGSGSIRGEWPIGVNFDIKSGKFKAQCKDGHGKKIHIGLFDDPGAASAAWVNYKLSLLERLRPEMDAIDARIYFTAKRIILEAK